MRKLKLGDVLDVKRGASLSGEFYAGQGERIRLTLGNFNYPAGGFKENASKTNIFFIGEVKQEFILKKGDIITPLTEQAPGLLGETARIPEDGLYIQSGDIGLVIPNEKLIDNSFAYYLISSPVVKKQLDAAAQQTKIRHTSPEKIKACEVWLPDIKHQKFTGALLDVINKKIECNNKIITELESMAKTIFDYWFLQFEFPNENGKPYKSSGGKMVWNEELKREIPVGWRVGSFSELLEIGNGKDHKELKNGSIPIYGSGGVIRTVDTPIYSGESVLIPRKGTLNHILYVNGAFWTVDTMFYTKMKKRHSAIFSYYSVRLYDFEKLNTGTGVPSMTSSIIYNLKVVIPPDKVLENFDICVQALYMKIQKNRTENQEFASLRDFLLPLLMNGQVGFKDSLYVGK